jgi:hypothetical protein
VIIISAIIGSREKGEVRIEVRTKRAGGSKGGFLEA